MPAPTKLAKSLDYKMLNADSAGMKEAADCSVISLAAVTGADYATAHAALAAEGRKNRKGAFTHQSLAALEALGFTHRKVLPETFIAQYPKAHQILKSVTTHHPDRFPKVWKDGKRYLLKCRGHILAVVNGENVDWTRGRAKRVIEIYEVIEKC